MFQNISNDDINEVQQEYEDVEFDKKTKIKNLFKKIFTKQNIFLYIISFCIPMVEFMQQMAPFGIALIAAICSNEIPVGIIYFITAIATFVKFGASRVFNVYINHSCICCFYPSI